MDIYMYDRHSKATRLAENVPPYEQAFHVWLMNNAEFIFHCDMLCYSSGILKNEEGFCAYRTYRDGMISIHGKFINESEKSHTSITQFEGRTCCSKCGIELTELDKYCPNCGRYIERME